MRHIRHDIVVQLLLCQPPALIPVNGQNGIVGENWTAIGCNVRPWGRQAVILVNESRLLVDCLGRSTSVLYDSAFYARK